MKKMISLLCYLLIVQAVFSQNRDSSFAAEIKSLQPFLYAHTQSNRLKLSLNSVHVQDELYWLSFSIRNRSNLSYPIELIRLFSKDSKLARRSSIQELEMQPLYIDAPEYLPAKSLTKFVIAVPKFTIPDNKSCWLEIFEANGGRNLALEIRNDKLFLAKNVSWPIDSPDDTTTLDYSLIKGQEYNTCKTASHRSRFIQVCRAYRYGKRMYLTCTVSNNWKKPFRLDSIKCYWQSPDDSGLLLHPRLEQSATQMLNPFSRREFVISFPLIKPMPGDWLDILFQPDPDNRLHDFLINFNTRELKAFDYVNKNVPNEKSIVRN